jgi:hypothetical protein
MKRTAKGVRTWNLKNACEILFGKHEGKNNVGKFRRGSLDITQTYAKGLRLRKLDSIGSRDEPKRVYHENDSGLLVFGKAVNF